VINTATCNAAHTAGCSAVAPTITVSPFPGPPVLDPGTATLYAPFGASSNRVAVVDTATCNAEVSAGCGQIPGVADVADGTNVIALSAPTHTIYAPAIGMPAFSGDTVSVIDGATCNGTNHSGCGHLAATVKVGNGPFGVAVDDKTHTVYVANNANGDSPGTLSMIDAATCNGSDTAGCAAHLPTIPVGRSPLGVAVDTLTNRVFVTDFSSAAVSVVNGSTCNAEVRTGCAHATREQAVISSPSGIVVNQNTNTVFTMSFFMSGSTSIFRGSP
jgi:DNA-binding beta-propeller fold protein YncE